MSSLEQVVIELQEINQYQNLQIDTEYTQNEILGNILECLSGIKSSMMTLVDHSEDAARIAARQASGPVDESTSGSGTSGRPSFVADFKEFMNDSTKQLKESIEKTKNSWTDIVTAASALGISIGTSLKNVKALGIGAKFTNLGKWFSTLGTRLFAFASSFSNMGFMEGLGNLFRGFARMMPPVLAVLGTIEGIIEGLDFFNKAGEGVQSRIMAAIEGFVGGFIGVLLSPLDFIINGIGDFFGIEWMQKLSLVEDMKLGVEVFFNLLEDLGQMFGDMYDDIMASAFVTGLRDIWGKITDAFDGFLDSLIETYNKIAKYVPGLPMIGEDTREKGPTSEDFKQEKKEAREAGRAARDSGLYDRNIIGESTIDEGKLQDAPIEQLKVILNEDDLSEEQYKLVFEEYKKRLETQVETRKMAKRLESTDTSGKAGDKRGMTIGDSPAAPTERKANGKLGMTIGDSPAAPTERMENGKLGKTIGDSPAAPTERMENGKLGMTIGSESSSNSSSSLNSSSSSSSSNSSNSSSSSNSSNSSSSSNVESNVRYDVLDPVTNELIATTSTTDEATKVSMETGGYIVSRIVDTSSQISSSTSTSGAEKVGVGTIQTALNPTSTALAPVQPASLASTASGSNTMGSMRDNLSNEQARLDETKAKENGGGSSVAMVNAPSSSSTTVNNSNFSGGTMSPTDNTDRTYGNYKSSRR